MLNREEIVRTSVGLAKIGLDVGDVLDLMKIERTLHRLDEADCNVGLSPAQERRVERLEAQAQKIVDEAKADAIAYHQSDPRGGALWIVPRKMVWPGDKVAAVYPRGVCV
jgi:hypothetical protein